jgi:hypothetical protein
LARTAKARVRNRSGCVRLGAERARAGSHHLEFKTVARVLRRTANQFDIGI